MIPQQWPREEPLDKLNEINPLDICICAPIKGMLYIPLRTHAYGISGQLQGFIM